MTQAEGGERRTQAQRRTATQSALLDATIDSLIHEGWAATTTRSVAERAGVSQGAQQHHFPTKADLVAAAISHLMHQLAADTLAMPLPGGSERERAHQLLDRLWEIHTNPVNGAVFELLTLARTDADIAKLLAPALIEGVTLTYASATALMPTIAATPGFDDFLLIAEATMRGAAIAAIPGAKAAYPQWPIIRRHLQSSLDQILAEHSPHDEQA